ncbi:uncharacterized protein N7500_003967 [Penicillium coprophilum]|uniref:uncharacterized protein n=1 Tax=Penicillium coprophilum TaxID=36646 RepID=UPI00238703A5|nr:uncharacterized protein N7500_003967 [Penicillium coprophilum]KAJ5171184.1 hypothetical protein N7500_003967 [Penicillium coprophilum]
MFSFNRPDDPDANEKPSLLTSFTLKGWLSNNKTKTDPDDSSTNSPHGRAWIKGVVICARVITIILAINITMAITAVGLAYSKNREQDFSFAAVYTGKCSLAKNWMTGLHLIINILSTVLLGASNYCMQCLASPSRAQVDKAHSKRVWVPIGVPNIWGLLWSDRGKRQLLGWMLLATSLPIHLIYNSAIFLSNSPTDYTVLIAPPGPMNGTGSEGWNSCFNATVGLDIETVRAEMSRSDLKKLSVKDCIDTFAQDFVSGQRMVILVTEDPISDGEPLAFMGLTDPFDFDHVGSSFYTINRGFDWMCSEEDVCSKDFVHDMVKGKEWNVQPLTVYTLEAEVQVPTENGFQNLSWPFYPEDYQTPDMERLNEVLQQARHEGEVQAALHDPSSWSNASFPGNVTVFRYSFQCPEYSGLGRMEQKVRIKHCLTVPKDESCRLMFSLPICLVVIMCNLIKLICALLTARDGREELFLTVGDAIASYLAYPDPTTEGSCLLSRWLVGKGSQGWRRKTKKNDMLGAPSHSNLPLQISPRKRWFQAASTRLWISTITLFVCILVLSIFALVIAFSSSADVSRGTIWDNTIGEPRPQSLINMRTPDGVIGIFVMILLPNGLQLFVSIAYFMLNALMTAMLGAVEYNDYAQNRKPLRVSWPAAPNAPRTISHYRIDTASRS